MKQSKTKLYLHFVWATYQRLPLVMTEHEQGIYACIVGEAGGLGSEVLAIGGMPDHVHLVVKTPAKHAPSRLMQRIKVSPRPLRVSA